MPQAKQPGLDGRHRNDDGTTRAKRGDTEVGTLRRIYGDDFAAGHRSDMRLDTLLKREGVKSLNDLLEKK
ncbi:MAG: hypothetical protein IT537_31660 [Hyphomicrobiales bacterium]|nr:hypothetical protein [Hyphomicrobiales bacterium]